MIGYSGDMFVAPLNSALMAQKSPAQTPWSTRFLSEKLQEWGRWVGDEGGSGRLEY